MSLHVLETYVDVVYDVFELFARRREGRILQPLRKVIGLGEVL